MKSAKPVLTLNQFMVRGQVIKQYRDFLRTAKKLPDENMKKVTYLIGDTGHAKSLIAIEYFCFLGRCRVGPQRF